MSLVCSSEVSNVSFENILHSRYCKKLSRQSELITYSITIVSRPCSDRIILITIGICGFILKVCCVTYRSTTTLYVCTNWRTTFSNLCNKFSKISVLKM